MADAHNHASPWAVSGIAWRKVGVNIRRAAAGEELEIWVDWLQVEAGLIPNSRLISLDRNGIE